MTREGKLVIDDPEIRGRLIRAMDSYTAIDRKGCTPPDAVGWDNRGNNQAFLAQTVVMTANWHALDPERAQARASGRLLQEHRHDRMAGWRRRPAACHPDRLYCRRGLQSWRACSFGQGVRALSGGRRLARALSRLLRRALPLADAEAARAAVLARPERPPPHGRCDPFLTGPRIYNYWVVSGEPRHLLVRRENVWSKAVYRVAADGISPEQAVDEAIARIKQILAEWRLLHARQLAAATAGIRDRPVSAAARGASAAVAHAHGGQRRRERRTTSRITGSSIAPMQPMRKVGSGVSARRGTWRSPAARSARPGARGRSWVGRLVERRDHGRGDLVARRPSARSPSTRQRQLPRTRSRCAP